MFNYFLKRLQDASDLAGLITVATQEFTNVWSRIGFSDHDKFRRLSIIIL